ncbi:hypothetical protein ETC04_00730 [Geobacillus sp. MR]|nr:hypothetical protein [Geobacillus sp. MR]
MKKPFNLFFIRIKFYILMMLKPPRILFYYQRRTCYKTHNECINAHKKSTTLEIIYSDQKKLPRGGHDHDFQFRDRTCTDG